MTTLVTQPSIESSLFNSLATLTGSQTIANKTIKTTKENVTIVSTAPPTTVNFDVATQSIMWYNSNTTANFVINTRGSSTQTLDSLLNTGESIISNLFVQNSTTPYYPTAYQIDGVAVTPLYQGGIPFSYGNQFATDLYVVFIIKTGVTGTPAWKLFVSQTKFG